MYQWLPGCYGNVKLLKTRESLSYFIFIELILFRHEFFYPISVRVLDFHMPEYWGLKVFNKFVPISPPLLCA